ncbi:MAG TPA: Ig-like domain-containing protein [Stellaceae bacterium]|nr:Ig-like domain-containing protein [Stellaceae bacterium]
MILRGSVRRSIVLGSAAAVLLLGGGAALVVHHGGRTDARPPSAQVTALSPGGAVSEPGPPVRVNPAPEPSQPTRPSFDVVKVGPTGTAVIAGRAEPGSRVTVRDGDKIIGEVTADRRGEWVLVPEQPIGAGDRLLSLEASNQEGATVKSDETVALSIGPAASDKRETALAVVLPRDGAGPARVLQRPDAASPTVAAKAATDEQIALSVDAVEYDEQGRAVLSGHAKPGAKVQIYAGNEAFATAVADAAGGWSATAIRPIGPKQLELRLDQLGGDGRVVERVSVPLARIMASQLAAGQNYVVQRGNSLWQIARRTYGNGVRYLIIYSANLGQIRDPERIYPGQVFKLPKS